jgi:hypothetical protein
MTRKRSHEVVREEQEGDWFNWKWGLLLLSSFPLAALGNQELATLIWAGVFCYAAGKRRGGEDEEL